MEERRPNDPSGFKEFGAIEIEVEECTYPITPTTSAESRSSDEPKGQSELYSASCTHTSPRAWRPSFFRFRPLAGLAALLLTVMCMLASLITLIVSDNQPTANWHVDPSVWLAIYTAVSNTALRSALALAAPISWWVKVFKGSTVGDLEMEWEAGQSYLRAVAKSLKSRRFMGMLALASIFTTLVLIDGPLLQHSSTVGIATVHRNTSIDLDLSPEIPSGFSGIWYPGYSVDITDQSFEVFNAYTNGDPIKIDDKCGGSCAGDGTYSTTVHGPGITVAECTRREFPISNELYRSKNATWGPGHYMGRRPFIFSQLLVDLGIPADHTESLQLITGLLNMERCSGSYVINNCKLVAAVLEWNVTIEDGSINAPAAANPIRVVSIANNTSIEPLSTKQQNLAYEALAFPLMPYVSMRGVLGPIQKDGEVPLPWEFSIDQLAAKFYNMDTDSCTVITHDPSDYIIGQLNQLLFRAGMMSATWPNITGLIDEGLSVQQTVPAKQTQKENVFHSDLRWFAGAAALQLLTIFLILPVFWGYWRVGVDFSLSPFHTGRFFDARVFESVSSAQQSSGMATDPGSIRLRLGVVERQGHVGGDIESQNEMGSAQPRLGIADSRSVKTPRIGAPPYLS